MTSQEPKVSAFICGPPEKCLDGNDHDELGRMTLYGANGTDGPVTPTLQEMTEDELRTLWRAADAIRRLVKDGIDPDKRALMEARDRTMAKAREGL
jgi:hypothetical protein